MSNFFGVGGFGPISATTCEEFAFAFELILRFGKHVPSPILPVEILPPVA